MVPSKPISAQGRIAVHRVQTADFQKYRTKLVSVKGRIAIRGSRLRFSVLYSLNPSLLKEGLRQIAPVNTGRRYIGSSGQTTRLPPPKLISV